MPGFVDGSCLVLFELHRMSFSLVPDLETRFMPAFMHARLSWWYVGPGMYGMQMYGLYSSSFAMSYPLNGSSLKRFSVVWL